MKIDLKGRTVRFIGATGPVQAALAEAATANGAQLTSRSEAADTLVVCLPLLPEADVNVDALLDEMQAAADTMAARGAGRILLVTSAIAVMPMRRHPEFSRRIAGGVPAVRSLAMHHGGQLIINALAVGAVGEPAIAGDSAMLSHAPLARAGATEEVVGAALFLLDPRNSYTTGQVLVVDGGWSVGYGRSF